ncbi:hypothetical protein [Helicobacter sp. MIT 05-5294]|uniref:hypothetical protein n=1 Tax=Helicobacter sp. MIT 05-5294 TaxID=1548150 RepID=UPI00051FE620|nr:hypothetical protein [Helicobacter sp. MIT 05-5294]TLD87245.1 hypothetical protein LS69_004300 [Helicobacter sp. MIT 05-5294]
MCIYAVAVINTSLGWIDCTMATNFEQENLAKPSILGSEQNSHFVAMLRNGFLSADSNKRNL